MAKSNAKQVTDTIAGISRAGEAVRDLLARYTKRRKMKEGHVALLLYGYLVAKLGAPRVHREYPVSAVASKRKTSTKSTAKGRPEQIDFVIGRKRHTSGSYEPSTLVEFAIRRDGHRRGAEASENTDEIAKLVRARGERRMLLLLDITCEDIGSEVLRRYQEYPRSRGKPPGKETDTISVVYVGEQGVRKVRVRRQRFKKPTKSRRSGR